MLGDFNDIRNNEEKIGGPRLGEKLFQPFNDMLSACEMVELPSSGNNLTWGGLRCLKWIQSRLDRCFGNKKWLALFPASNQIFLDKRGSDHRPVLVKLLASADSYRGSFKFDGRFLNRPGVKEEVKKAWLTNHTFFGSSVSEKLKRCRKSLSRWKKKSNLNSRDKIIQIQVALETEQSSSFPSGVRVNYLKAELVKAYKEEEKYWRQRSKDKWAVEGDLNTRYYHASVKSRRARKRIEKLMDEKGQMQFSEAAKAQVATDYFIKLFTSEGDGNFDQLFHGFDARVDETMNEMLLREVTNEEVRDAVFSINPASAPGPDGMSGLFFQKYWSTVGNQVTEEVKSFFVQGTFPKEWNYTHLCLLPKIVDPVLMSDLRPISLCSVLYKIISKIMVGRLKPLLPNLVSPTQSAFVEERLITDNILIAHEMVHALRTNEKISANFMAIKSDMSKAYDRVEWNYLRALLKALGFAETWIERVMFCVSTVTFSTLINNQAFGWIQPKRGLRQGDPLSPFLFILCTEGLIHMLESAVCNNKIQGIKFSDRGPMVHHMLFADDSLLICRANEEQARELMRILKIYERATGQMVSIAKSAVTFGSRVPEATKEAIKRATGIHKEGGTGSYLGLPECFSGSKTEMLAYIYDRLKDRLSGWFLKQLSLGGKEILIKAVAMAMPIYAMSCFKLTKKSCENLTKAMADFWWNSLEHKRKMHWLSWSKLSLAKEQGGLGFKDLQSFNQALLAKQAWRILNDPGSLFASVFKSRYFPHGEFLSAKNGPRPSYAWRSIQFGKELLILGITKKIGNGRTVSVWVDAWIEGEMMRRPLMKNIFVDLLLCVDKLIDQETRCWNLNTLHELFYEEDVVRIVAMKPVFEEDDFWVWKYNKHGGYSVKSGYWLKNRLTRSEEIREAQALPSLNGLKTEAWNLKAPPKIKTFFWRALSNAISAGELLVKRGIKMDPCCQACGFQGESINHILFTCPIARQVWALANVPSPLNGFDEVSHYSNFHFLFSLGSNKMCSHQVVKAMPWLVWFLWKNRNSLLFDGKQANMLDLVAKTFEEAEMWSLAQINDRREEEEQRVDMLEQAKRWSPPPRGWLKCNIGVDWMRSTQKGGGAWVIRDHNGKVLIHSRRAFPQIKNLHEAKLEALLWSIESICAHHFNRVIFAIDDGDLTGMILRPKAWPNFKGECSTILNRLGNIDWWRLVKEERANNRGAFLIAQSVTKGGRLRSYVATGSPSWLRLTFENEEILSSV